MHLVRGNEHTRGTTEGGVLSYAGIALGRVQTDRCLRGNAHCQAKAASCKRPHTTVAEGLAKSPSSDSLVAYVGSRFQQTSPVSFT